MKSSASLPKKEKNDPAPVMRAREDIEALEAQVLAPYAMKSRDSKGRIHTEDPHPTRTCYQRDRDRIVHCEAFRNLEYKTQVFTIYEGDYYRTRLTHTIEVAQIARTIGRSLRLNEDLIEAVALAHDLGHPPFGHAGENILNELMGGDNRINDAGKKTLIKFNHNRRSFDIVDKFEKRYPHFSGLNLTIEVLIGILKHETGYDEPSDHASLKDGPVLEAKVVDIADSLAYLSHDVDDGLTSGCIKEDDLKESALWQKAYDKVIKIVDTDDKDLFKYQIVKALIDMQVRDLLAATEQRLQALDFRSSDEVKQYTGDKKTRNNIIIGFGEEMHKERKHLQRLLLEKFYNHQRVLRMTKKAERIIKDLFAVYQENVEQIPKEICRRAGNPGTDDKDQIICNSIASMTDRFAINEHKKLFDPYEKV